MYLVKFPPSPLLEPGCLALLEHVGRQAWPWFPGSLVPWSDVQLAAAVESRVHVLGGNFTKAPARARLALLEHLSVSRRRKAMSGYPARFEHISLGLARWSRHGFFICTPACRPDREGEQAFNLRLRPYHVESTGSRPITEVKQRRAWLVLGWVTAWEYQVP